MKRNILAIILSIVLSGGIFLSVGQQASATWDFNPCDWFDCNPTIIVPSIEPSVPVSEEPTQAPTVTPCLVWVGEFQEPCPTDTPSATPSATIDPTTPPSPHGDGLSDGRESGHINAPSIPKAPPSTGRG